MPAIGKLAAGRTLRQQASGAAMPRLQVEHHYLKILHLAVIHLTVGARQNRYRRAPLATTSA